MSLACNRLLIRICITMAGIRIAVVGFQNRQRIVVTAILDMQDTGNTRCVVRRIRLKLATSEGLLKSHLAIHSLINRISLIAVGHDRFISQHTDRCIDNQTRIFQLRRIKCLCADALTFFYKHTVAAVLASSHDKVCRNRLLSVRRPSNDNSASRIRIVFQFLCYRYSLHNGKASSFIVVQ